MGDMRRPVFLGALIDVLPSCIYKTRPNGEKTEGIYNGLLTEAIGKGAYDHNGTRNAAFLKAKNVCPFPEGMRYACSHVGLDATNNPGLNRLWASEEWRKLGALAKKTPTDVMNRGAAERTRIVGVETGNDTNGARYEQVPSRDGQGRQTRATMEAMREDQGQQTTKEWRDAMAEAIAEAEAEGTMEEIEDARSLAGQGMRSRGLDGLQISFADRAAGLANTSEGGDARHARAEEDLRGK